MKLLIKNGIIVDGSGSERKKADLLIEGDEIRQIGQNFNAPDTKVIDATDRIVTPGFIDIHNHSDLTILDLPKMEAYIMQGVTTVIGGLCGFGIAPANDLVIKYYSNVANRLLSVSPQLCKTVGDFFDKLEKKGISINFGYLIPQGNVRALKLGVEERAANSEELEFMRDVMRKNMEDGAFGMSTGLVYVPGEVTSTEELIELAKVVAEYDGVYVSHMRNEGAGVIDIGMTELIRIAREAKCRGHISHWSVISSSVEELTPKAIRLVEDSRAEGLEITADITTYPDAVNPIALMALNTWVFDDFENNLTNPKTRKAIIDEMFQKFSSMFLADAPLFVRLIPKFILKKIMFPQLAKRVSILSCPNNPKIQGKLIYDACKQYYPNKSIREAFLDLLRDEEGGLIITLITKNEEKGMIPLFKLPYVCASSDGILVVNPEQNEHPRNYGTFPRVIQRWVREKGFVTLETAIHKMTGLPAENMRIRDRGLLKEGYKADIVIFDYNNIQEKGTLENGRQFPEGIDYVIVNGQITAEKGKHLGTINGRPIRHKK